MADSRHRDQYDLKRPGNQLGAADFEAAPYAVLPDRRQARPQISTPRDRQNQRLSSDGRRLSRSERRRIQHQHQDKMAAAAPGRRGSDSRSMISGRGRVGTVAKLGGLFCISAILLMIGTSHFYRNGTTSSPSSTDQFPIAIVSSPAPTETPEPTVEPTLPPIPTPFIDARYVGKVICLDPGHGGSDRGFHREAGDIAPAMEEATYNLAFARALKTRLESRGFTVVMTREADEDVNKTGADINGDGKTAKDGERAKMVDELQARINICNGARADLLISMHINGFDDPAVAGYETWYSSARPFTPLNKFFATLAFDELGRQMREAGYNATARMVNDDANAHAGIGKDAFDRYVITGPAQKGQITPSAMPGAIIEVGFISNEQDAAFMAGNAGRNAIVTAYENAVMRYFNSLPTIIAAASPESTPVAQEPKP